MPSINSKTWDIFCRVVDNFGDIGVCWRLARQLAAEHDQQVRLWVDDVNALIRIWPDAQQLIQQPNQQMVAGVEVCCWNAEFTASLPIADVVIEAFACDIPPAYKDAMAARKRSGTAPIWVNLDYLSAEAWVEDCHLMPSTQPATGLRKTFFFPGFTERTGGLLREASLIKARDNFQAAPWLASIGVTPQPDALVVSLFAYENPSVASLFSAWATSSEPIHCLVPQGKVLSSINSALSQDLAIGDIYRQGNLCIQVIPFVTQTEYDKLLWACDINFVRGEDSFVRAQWAAKPLFWHIYPQDDDVHITKLRAFLEHYTRALPSPLKSTLEQAWLAWNTGNAMESSWQQLMPYLTQWQTHSQIWCTSLLEQPDLARQLVDFCTDNQA
jgi:uncharacterized repeat protein (TIGR03837 family)